MRASTTTATAAAERARARAALLLALGVAAALAAGPAAAQDLSPVATMLQTVVTALTGPIGQALAVIAVIGSGIACLLGRINFGWFASVLVGVVLIFGGPAIVAGFAT